MYPMGDPALVARDPIFAADNYRRLDADHGWVTGGRARPLTRALADSVLVCADAGGFRTLDANSGLIRPLIGRDVHVSSLPEREARNEEECREWRLGIRWGPNAPGVSPRRIYDSAATHRGSEWRAFGKSWKSFVARRR